MEDKVTLALSRQDREVDSMDSAASAATRSLSQLQTSHDIAKRTLKEKSGELSRLEKHLSVALKESGKENADEAVKDAESELRLIRE
jgi:hypothetical protein